jgi:hypothetical protein
MINKDDFDLSTYLKRFSLKKDLDYYLEEDPSKTIINYIEIDNVEYARYINEYWTSKQRQSSSLHEISYRACFKAELPRFFIKIFTKKDDIVYDPFSGRGTTPIEAVLMGRNSISNDINPLSEILVRPRMEIPPLNAIIDRLKQIPFDYNLKAKRELSMFYHSKTESEIISLRRYLIDRKKSNQEDHIDRWIRMVATSRLTGHSKGFFSVYTLPPNQATTPERQIKINEKRNQKPGYRAIIPRVIKKSKSLLRDLSDDQIKEINKLGKSFKFYNNDARNTQEIESETIQLTVTSPPFLDIVNYSEDNWLRCWFNSIDIEEIEKRITVTSDIEEWSNVMADVFEELYRITRNNGWVAFEVGEIRKGNLELDKIIVPLGEKAGFKCEGILINQQDFTKTSNIWGVDNNESGTNSNRIVLLNKKE